MKKLLSLMVLILIPLQSIAGTILVLGDSISAAYGIPLESGWVAIMDRYLREKFPQDFEVVNASVSGETSTGGLFRLPPLLEKHEPDLVIVELGGNDGLRGMPVAQMEKNLTEIVRKSLEQGSKVALISVNLPVSYGEHFNRLFQQAFQRIAEKEPVFHVEMGFKNLNDRNLLQSDGIHPTADAQPLLFELIWATIEPAVDAIATSSHKIRQP